MSFLYSGESTHGNETEAQAPAEAAPEDEAGQAGLLIQMKALIAVCVSNGWAAMAGSGNGGVPSIELVTIEIDPTELPSRWEAQAMEKVASEFIRPISAKLVSIS